MMDVARILELLNVLYPSPDAAANFLPNQTQQTEAHKALYDFMAEPSAWFLASEILDSLGTHAWAEVRYLHLLLFFNTIPARITGSKRLITFEFIPEYQREVHCRAHTSGEDSQGLDEFS